MTPTVNLRPSLPGWLRCLTVGQLGTNCYLLIAHTAQAAVVVDPGGDAAAIIDAIEHAGRPGGLGAVWLTHGHADHCGALPELLLRWPEAVVRASQVAGSWLADPAANLSGYIGRELQVSVSRLDGVADGDEIVLARGGPAFRAIATPGHTPGCMCFFADVADRGPTQAPPVLLSGDVLFAGSVGRTDLPGGSLRQLNASLRRLAGLPPATVVLPGHGPPTTIEAELRTNPYMRQALG